MSYVAKAAQYKKDNVTKVAQLLKKYPVIGVVNVESLPAAQLGTLRAKLRGEATIFMTKKSILNRAIDQVKESTTGLDKLQETIVGMPALLLSENDPFKISQLIKKSKSKAPAKPGQTAPGEIVIPAGPTAFTPGPIISELGAAGLKTGVEDGKIVIKEDKVVLNEGDTITAEMASLLAKFNIEPMEIGLDLVAAFQDGIVYGKKVLSVDPQEYLDMLTSAASESHALSLEIGYVTADNVTTLITKAYNTAKNFSLDNNIPSDELLKKELGEADRAASALQAKVGDAPAPEEKEATEEKKEETPAETPAPEETKEEAPAQPAEEKKETPADKPAEAPANPAPTESTEEKKE